MAIRRLGIPYFRAQAQATAFALLGDRYHNSDHYRTAVGRTLVEGAGLSIDFSDEYTLVNADHLSRYRSASSRATGSTGPTATETRPATRGGGPGPRCSTTTSRTSRCTATDFRDVLGAAYQGHPPTRPFKVRILNPDHPITEGVRDFIVTDEQHYMLSPGHLISALWNPEHEKVQKNAVRGILERA